MPIALADLLMEQQVILRLRSRKPANAIREIVDVLASDIGGRKIAKPEAFLKEVLAREQTHPSAVENGVAFPHARTDLVDEIVVGVGAQPRRRSIRRKSTARASHFRNRRSRTLAQRLSGLRRHAGATGEG